MEDKVMKKTYINPNMLVVKLATQHHLLEASKGKLSVSESDRIGNSNDFGGHDDDFDW